MVVAYDLNRAIGANGDLPWKRDLPADLTNFKNLTMGGSIIMGRKTFESIGSRPLPGRENIVLSSQPVQGAVWATSLEDALKKAQNDIYIIGGERVFKEALPKADIIYATEVDYNFLEADTFFSDLGDDWQEVSRKPQPVDEKNQYPFNFVQYKRV